MLYLHCSGDIRLLQQSGDWGNRKPCVQGSLVMLSINVTDREDGTYPQFRQAKGSRRGSGQSRARCPSALQLTHFTPTFSKSGGVNSCLQPRVVCPISRVCQCFVHLLRAPTYRHSYGTWEPVGQMEILHLQGVQDFLQQKQANVREGVRAEALRCRRTRQHMCSSTCPADR
ncbi:hypothetical protein P170DRAFT_142149 [Aspergillus steynii IBT 23096]|uniref:Uncharacterized protein n=1 Tax=Aspergillus steynii IBT 23096 TaxID=1392250 RepID=A0A2I2GBT7_9EURO|nr:uncharacterized protein P170DRAFT_142149 [Aspergillus steynii IBT 23096]PLB50343.1 hypothetical protein P170DRAFT_142149 [Aspergillus steynii IBT 23096]